MGRHVMTFNYQGTNHWTCHQWSLVYADMPRVVEITQKCIFQPFFHDFMKGVIHGSHFSLIFHFIFFLIFTARYFYLVVKTKEKWIEKQLKIGRKTLPWAPLMCLVAIKLMHTLHQICVYQNFNHYPHHCRGRRPREAPTYVCASKWSKNGLKYAIFRVQNMLLCTRMLYSHEVTRCDSAKMWQSNQISDNYCAGMRIVSLKIGISHITPLLCAAAAKVPCVDFFFRFRP